MWQIFRHLTLFFFFLFFLFLCRSLRLHYGRMSDQEAQRKFQSWRISFLLNTKMNESNKQLWKHNGRNEIDNFLFCFFLFLIHAPFLDLKYNFLKVWQIIFLANYYYPVLCPPHWARFFSELAFCNFVLRVEIFVDSTGDRETWRTDMTPADSCPLLLSPPHDSMLQKFKLESKETFSLLKK